MKAFVAVVLLIIMFSCNKVVEVNLPAYASEITLEMYLENGRELRCLISESLPYTDSTINKPLDSALVVFSDGTNSYILQNKAIQDWENGRLYNYFNPYILYPDMEKTYSISITDKHNREVTASTRFLSAVTFIDSVVAKQSVNNSDSFSLGIVFKDPSKTDNYYRLLVAKKLNDFNAGQADILLNDIGFNGQSFSFFSEPDYSRGDSVTVRLYSLQKEYYHYIKSVEDARSSNFSPFVQPSWIKSNVSGGLGIFTAITYDEKEIIVK
ncbi:MAG: DUF4249 domain-containing protein [Flavitalea sp.]